MGLIDDLRNDARKPVVERCPVGKFLRELEDGERAEWEEALANVGEFKHVNVHKHMVLISPDISESAVRNHRMGRCRCGH